MASETQLRHAAIVAGGIGTRARPLTNDRIPKALLPVDGIPIIVRQLRTLAREGIESVTVLGGHLGQVLEQSLRPEAARLNMTLKVIVEAAPLGNAGCLTALGRVQQNTLIVYGDMLFDMYLPRLLHYHLKHSALLTIVAHPNDHPRTSDLLIEHNGRLTAIMPRSHVRDCDYRNLVPAGLFLAAPEFFERLIEGQRTDMMHDLLPRLLAQGDLLSVYNTPEYFRDIGTVHRHALAEHEIRNGQIGGLYLGRHHPAIFFDCDGVLNEERGGHGITKAEQIKLLPGAAQALRCVHEAGHYAIAITNRPQVAKGLIDFKDLDHILGHLEASLAERGGVLDRIYFCPHHPERGFPGENIALKIECKCRKPGSLLLRHAAEELPIDMGRSALIGDSLCDIGAAIGAGVWAYGVRTGYGCRDVARYARSREQVPSAHLMFATVGEAVKFALGYRSMAQAVTSEILRLPHTDVRPKIVAVGGRSRSGKSTVAHAVLRTLQEKGHRVLIIDLDRWIAPLCEREACATAEARNRVEVYPDLVAQLRCGKSVASPGYDPAVRGAGLPERHDPSGVFAILLVGVFAAHPSIRAMIDIACFVDCSEDVLRSRFAAFYAWKGLQGEAIEKIWIERRIDEWPAVDTQRSNADILLNKVEFS